MTLLSKIKIDFSNKYVQIFLITIFVIVFNILGGILYYKYSKLKTETPYLISEEIYELKMEYYDLIDEIKTLQTQEKTQQRQMQISYKYNELTVVAEQINSHMKLNDGENNFKITIPSLEYISKNNYDDIIEYSFQ